MGMRARPKAKRSMRGSPRVPLLGTAARLPDFIEPELATLVDAPPSGAGWLHEMKYDGYRGQLQFNHGKVRFLTRNGLDWTNRFHALVSAAASIRASTAVIDGEAVVMKTSGHSDFGLLQQALAEGRAGLVSFYAFDLLHLEGRDLRYIGLEERKRLLKDLIGGHEKIKFSDHIVGDAAPFYDKACALRLEGIVSKKCGSPYISGRSRDWLKSKCTYRQEFVIGGWRPSTASGKTIGSLLMGYYDDEGTLHFAGKVGTGIDDKTGRELTARLEAIERDSMAFAKVPAEFRRTSRWVEPKQVAEIEFTGWTHDNYIRHGSFKGLREDKKARDVRREQERAA